jgi:hypothetical protein
MESTSSMSNWLIMRNQSVATLTTQTKVPPTPLAERETFCEAIELFANWNPGDTEPTILFEGYNITVSDACRLVETCQNPLPKSFVETLRFCDVGLKKSQTYSEAARKLLARIKQLKQTQ